MKRTMHFLGVSTSESAATRLFPAWSQALGLDASLVGVDLALRADPVEYRQAIERLRDSPEAAGALVTSHKVDVYAAAADLFAELDSYASACGEISCVAKRKGVLTGFAKDPVTAVRALEGVLPARYFEGSGREVLCLGAGGAGAAITVSLLSRADRPSRVVLTDPRAERLDAVRESVVATGVDDVAVEYVHTDSGDEALAHLADGSMVINASGLGKDRPGSPLGSEATFPHRGIVWELNYRGELDFLRHAERQATERALTVVDGWEYFLHGWCEHMCEVFDLPWTAERFAAFASVSPRTPS